MKPLPLSGLRARLLGLVLMVILPALALIVVNAFQQKKAKASNVKQEALRLARIVAANQRQFIESTRHTLVTLSNLPAVTRRDLQRCGPVLAAVLREFAFYTNLGIATPNGDVICSALPELRPVNIADRLYFRQAVKTKHFSIGEYQIGRITGKQAINFGWSLLDRSGDVEAVLFAALDLRWLQSISSEMKLPKEAMVTLMDHKGVILARIRDPDLWTGKSAAGTPIGRTILEKKTGTTQEIGLDHQPRLYGFTVLKGAQYSAPLYFWVSIPETIAFAEVNRAFRRSLLILTLITLLILIAAWFGSDFFILRRVTALINASEKLAAGDMSARAMLPSDKGELGHLGRSFNKMADSLARRYAELQTLRDIDLSILSTLDLKSVLELLTEKIEIHLPYAAIAVALWDEKGEYLKPAAWRNIDLGQPRHSASPRLRTLPDLVWEYRAPLTIGKIRDAQTDDAEMLSAQGFTSYFGTPLQSKGEMLGILSFYTRNEHHFSPAETEFLTTLAGQASIAIYNSILYGQTRKQAADLVRANAVKDDFLGVISHELRTPLNVIMGYTEVLRDGTLGMLGAEQTEACEKIKRQTAALLAVINEILAATAIELKSIEANTGPIDLVQFMNDLSSSYGGLTGNKHLALRWNYPADLPLIATDGVKLRQILENLIGNAIKFTEQGSVTISALHVPAEGVVNFSVADTGIGIPKDLHAAIFEKFRQGDSSTLRNYEGVGLGLYIARQFTTLLGGNITVQSEPGKGSTFTLAIPTGNRSIF